MAHTVQSGRSFYQALIIMIILLCPCISYSSGIPVSSFIPSEEDTYITSCVADTYILSDYPDSNFDSSIDLRIESNGTESIGGQSWVFIKFDLTGFDLSNIVTLAHVNFWSKYAGPYPLVGVYWCHDNTWTENQLTWNNAPMESIENYSLDQKRNSVGSLYFDVTYALQMSLSKSIQSVTFVFKAEQFGDQYTFSKDDESIANAVKLWMVFVPQTSLDQVFLSNETNSGYIQDMWLHCDWINTGNSHLINIASACRPLSLYFPSLNLIGQHYFAPDGTELFVGHSLICYELFNDANENGYLDANFSSQDIETEYYFSMNFSKSFEPSPIEKSESGASVTYQWNIHYGDVTGFVLFRNGSVPSIGDTAAILTLDYIEIGFVYTIEGNKSYLKTSISIGEVDDLQEILEGFSLEGLGLSALYSTIILSSTGEAGVFVEDLNYDSRRANETSKEMTKVNITDSDTSFYDMAFSDNYTLISDESRSLQVTSSACTSTSIHAKVPRKQTQFPFNFYQGFLIGFLPRISGSTVDINLEYTESSLLYRICYPQWDGLELHHDPTFTAHLGQSMIIGGIPIQLVIPIVVITIICFIAVVIILRRKQHSP
ncbi:MAG: DNRLRE domain-containing protein [Candidatus Thorarchaeota archaeon]|nr:DNRLRE domain-containing protein [Candidatus Thorarchaeota archaeon]